MNITGASRTNSFFVKSDKKFEDEMSEIPDIDCQQNSNGSWVIFSDSEYGDFPSHYCDEDGEEYEIDLPIIISKHLRDEEVLIVMGISQEGMRSLAGYAEAINNKGERKFISLDQIYDLAAELGTGVTKANSY